MKLYEYQQEAINNIRVAFSKTNRVFFVLPTGAGKTFIFSHIAKFATKKGNRTWIICPRNELIWQSVASLHKLNIEPGIIAPKHKESDNLIHVVSKDTWIKRKSEIKNTPDFIIVDEGHLATNRYADMIETYPNAKFLFVSATPERLNGQDLTALAPPKDGLVYGPSMEWLIDNNYLAKILYLCPPVSGMENIKTRGTEFDRDQLEEWLSSKKIYAKTIANYKKYCTDKQGIVFCRDVIHAEETAIKFNEAGLKFESIDGKMARKKIRAIIDAVRNKELDGLTSCELVTYGLDVPNVKAIVMLRPTKSRALYYQMLGRGVRFTSVDDQLVVLDHVGNAVRNCDGKIPWHQPEWNYTGNVKRISDSVQSIRYCPYIGFMPCVKATCIGCCYNPEKEKPIHRWEEIDGELVPIIDSKNIKDMGVEEKKYYNNLIDDICNKPWSEKSVKELLLIASNTKRRPLWVYYKLRDMRIDMDLLKTIADIMDYKRKWIDHAVSMIH